MAGCCVRPWWWWRGRRRGLGTSGPTYGPETLVDAFVALSALLNAGRGICDTSGQAHHLNDDDDGGTGLVGRRLQAEAGAMAATTALACLGIEVVVTGSLARGNFGPRPDVDILVTACPQHLKYAIEKTVVDELAGVPFDIAYPDGLQARKIPGFPGPAIHASQIR